MVVDEPISVPDGTRATIVATRVPFLQQITDSEIDLTVDHLYHLGIAITGMTRISPLLNATKVVMVVKGLVTAAMEKEAQESGPACVLDRMPLA
jgi:hypothetical protein